LPVGHHPGIELTTSDQDLAANAVVRKRTRRVVQKIAELPDTEATVARKGFEGQKRVQGGADDHPLGQNATNLGGFS
jgi:hypothetical protein